MRIFVFALVGAVSLLATTARAEVIQHHPKLAAHLGSGYDARVPWEQFDECVSFDGQEAVDAQAASTMVRLSMIRSHKELYESLNISASVEGRYLLYGGGTEVSVGNEVEIGSDTVVWALVAKADYGRHRIKAPKLKQEFKDLAARSRREFAERCGTHYVGMVRRGGNAVLVFTLRGLTSAQKKSISASLEGAASEGVWSVELKAKYEKLVTEMSSKSMLDVHFFAVGGDGLATAKKLVTSAQDLDALKKVLEEYLGTIRAETSPSLEYFITPYSALGASSAKVSVRDTEFAELLYLYRRARDLASGASRLLLENAGDASDPRCAVLIDTAKLRARIEKLEAFVESVVEQAKQCSADKSCKPPKLPAALTEESGVPSLAVPFFAARYSNLAFGTQQQGAQTTYQLQGTVTIYAIGVKGVACTREVTLFRDTPEGTVTVGKKTPFVLSGLPDRVVDEKLLAEVLRHLGAKEGDGYWVEKFTFDLTAEDKYSTPREPYAPYLMIEVEDVVGRKRTVPL